MDSGQRPTNGPRDRDPALLAFAGFNTLNLDVEELPAFVGARGTQEDMLGGCLDEVVVAKQQRRATR